LICSLKLRVLAALVWPLTVIGTLVERFTCIVHHTYTP
jgi:hypothetical protein